MNIIEYIIGGIAPHECLACSKEGSVLCSDCMALLTPIDPCCYRCKAPIEQWRTCIICQPQTALTQVVTGVAYTGNARKLIHALKFNRAAYAAHDIGHDMAKHLKPFITPQMVITHVPTATSRVRMRGYDQSAYIAKRMSRELGLPYVPLLARTGQQRQVGQRRDQRAQQLAMVFRATKPYLLRDSRIILIDDVLTTGSTLEAAASVLARAGATHITAATFAAA